MQPIHQLLSRIRWDETFSGDFELAYADRGQEELVRLSLANVEFEKGNSFSFTALGDDKLYHDIPYHRVREVYRDGELIWKRPEKKEEQ